MNDFSFAANLIRIMEHRKISVVKLSKKTGLSKTQLYFYLNAMQLPRVDTAKHIASCLKVSLGSLVVGLEYAPKASKMASRRVQK